MRNRLSTLSRGSTAPRLIQIIAANRWEQPWRHALDVCRHFSDTGWSVTAYTRDAKAIDTPFRNAGIDLRHSPLRGFFDVYAAWQLARDLRHERRGTIIHVHRYRDAFAVLLARKLARRKDIRVVSTRHKLGRGARSALARRIYRNLDAQIFISTAVRDSFLSAWPDGRYPFPKERLHILIPTVNLPADCCTQEPEKGPRIVLCNTGLRPGTGLETLIDAMPMLRGMKTRFRIVGDGDTDYIDSLRRRAQVLGVMEMIDWQLRPASGASPVDMCHLSVDPTLTPTPFGPTHITCMAHGRAQVLSSEIYLPGQVRDGLQVSTVDAGDAEALGHTIRHLIEHPDQREAMARAAAHTYARHFSWHRCAETLRNLYSSL